MMKSLFISVNYFLIQLLRFLKAYIWSDANRKRVRLATKLCQACYCLLQTCYCLVSKYHTSFHSFNKTRLTATHVFIHHYLHQIYWKKFKSIGPGSTPQLEKNFLTYFHLVVSLPLHYTTLHLGGGPPCKGHQYTGTQC